MFNHMNMGRTSFIPVEYEPEANIQIGNFQGDGHDLP